MTDFEAFSRGLMANVAKSMLITEADMVSAASRFGDPAVIEAAARQREFEETRLAMLRVERYRFASTLAGLKERVLVKAYRQALMPRPGDRIESFTKARKRKAKERQFLATRFINLAAAAARSLS